VTGGTQPRGTPSAQAAVGVVLAGVAPRGRKTHWQWRWVAIVSPCFLPGAKFFALFLFIVTKNHRTILPLERTQRRRRPAVWR
jgi:hypothetical protein